MGIKPSKDPLCVPAGVHWTIPFQPPALYRDTLILHGCLISAGNYSSLIVIHTAPHLKLGCNKSIIGAVGFFDFLSLKNPIYIAKEPQFSGFFPIPIFWSDVITGAAQVSHQENLYTPTKGSFSGE